MSSAPADDPHIAAAIARFEGRRAVLERVTEVILEVFEAEAEGFKGVEAQEREAGVRRVERLARSVRMTIALAERVDARILALRNGDLGSRFGARSRAAVRPAPAPDDDDACPVREPIQGAVWSAIEQAVSDPDQALHRFDRLHERLFESEEYDRFDLNDFEGSVRAICKDLGVQPDWRPWTKGEGFAPPRLRGRPAWRDLWRWPSDEPEPRRLRILANPAQPEGIKALARAGPFKLE